MTRLVTKKIVGAVLLVLGLVILLTPFTPGSILILVGLDMLAGHKWPWWNKTKKKILLLFKKF